MQDGDSTGCLIGLIGFVLVFALLLGYAWVELYRLWMRQFHRKPLSSAYQGMKLLGWLLLVALVASITMFFLQLFGLF